MEKYDFGGWATRCNVKCSDGKTIVKDAFKHNHGLTVPLVWMHQHDSPFNVLGHALLENREDGVYAYCSFNPTEQGQSAKMSVEHGDIVALSIYANRLQKTGPKGAEMVMHGDIREVSLVMAGANPQAFIEDIIRHGEIFEDEIHIYFDEGLDLEPELVHSEEGEEGTTATDPVKPDSEKTVADVFASLNEEQKTVVYALVGEALSENGDTDPKPEGDNNMKHNVFDNDKDEKKDTLTHSDVQEILTLAKSRSVGTFQDALSMYMENHDTLSHSIDDIETLFPEYKDVRPGAPELLTRDQGWISTVMQKAHKSPISRIRTRQTDARDVTLRAQGYEKGAEKTEMANVKLLNRTTDPQTVYIKDRLDRDDILDITDFDVVSYLKGIMRMNLNEEIATAIMIGDGRADGDADRIDPTHIRPIWLDDPLYTIHATVDIDAAEASLNGTGTGVSFGENYIYAEAIIEAALYARENYKGSGSLDFYCTPHLLNVMLLARDLNGRRIYDSKNDLAAALNVGNIYTAEQFEGKTRTTTDATPKTMQLLGLFVNLGDYQIGSAKGGEITSFNQFDIDFNQEKYLMETRISGALTRVYSAIALEQDVTAAP